MKQRLMPKIKSYFKKTCIAVALTVLTAIPFKKLHAGGKNILSTGSFKNFIGINHNFKGEDLVFFGRKVDKKDDIIIVFSGGKQERKVTRKYQHWSKIWLSYNPIEVRNIPDVYVLLSNKPVTSILDTETLHKFKIGIRSINFELSNRNFSNQVYEAIKKIINTNIKNHKFLEKQKNSIEHIDGNLFKAGIRISPLIDEGNYSIVTYEISNKNIKHVNIDPIIVSQVGFISSISNFAKKEAKLYYVGCVFLSLTIGLLSYLIFSNKKKLT